MVTFKQKLNICNLFVMLVRMLIAERQTNETVQIQTIQNIPYYSISTCDPYLYPFRTICEAVLLIVFLWAYCL